MRAVFLDRDGVVNHVVMRDGRPGSPRSAAELALEPDAAAAVARLRDAGFLTFVVTNQPDLARGLLEPVAHEAIMARIRQELAPDAVLACPHDDADGCDCRKPRPGMLRTLARERDVDLAASYMIGDSWRDIEAGRAAGCRTVLIRRDYNTGVAADLSAAGIAEATNLILADTAE